MGCCVSAAGVPVLFGYAELTKGVAGLLVAPIIGLMILLNAKSRKVFSTPQFYLGSLVFVLLAPGFCLKMKSPNKV